MLSNTLNPGWRIKNASNETVFRAINLDHSISTTAVSSDMSQVAYSASFVSLLPALGSPEIVNKRMVLMSALATDVQDTTPCM